MARIRAKDFNIQTGNVSSVTVAMPRHEAGDVLLVFAGKDDATGTDPTTATTDWLIGGQGVSGGATTAAVRCGWFIKRATSAAEADLVITSSDADSWSIVAMSIEGAGPSQTITNASWAANQNTFTVAGHGFVAGCIVSVEGVTPSGYNGTYRIVSVTTDTFVVADTVNPGTYTSGGTVYCLTDADSGNGNTDATGAPFDVTGVTTNYANSLVFYCSMSGGTGTPVHYPGLMGVSFVDSGNEGVGVAYTVKATAGATGTKTFYTDATNTNTRGFCVAVRDSGATKIAPYWDTDWATLIHPFRGSSTIITSDVWGTALTNYPSTGKDAVDYCVQVDQSGGPSYVDYTSAANNSTDADVVPYPATEAAGAEGTGDWFAIGHEKPFNCLTFDLAGCTQGVAGVVAWEYWNGSAWAALSSVTDGTTGFTIAVADNLQVRWAYPANFNWAKRSINGSASLYFVRARCTTVWTTNPTISQVYVGGQALVYDAVGASGDAGVIQWENAANVTATSSTVQAGGTYIDLGTTVNLANKIITGTYQFSLPRDYVDSAQFKEGGGVHLMFADTSFNRKTWIVGNYLDAETNDAQRNRFAIDWEQTVDTTSARTTTDPSDTIADVGFFNLAPRGAGSVAFSHMIAVDPANAVVNGGTSANPINLAQFIDMGNASPVQLFRDYILMIPVTIGGSDDVYFDISDFTLTFPGVATPWSDIYNTSPRTLAHYDTGVLGFIINAQAGDVVKFRSGKISSVSTWRFEMASGCSASATYDFSGLLLVNATVTLRDVHTFVDMDFQSCTVTTNGATIQDCFFTNTPVTVGAPANAAEISDCSFTSSGTGHGMVITGTAADFTLTGVTFSGYAGTNGSTGNEAIYVNIASGSMTITISGGTTPSIRTAGATVTVQNNVTITLTGLQNPSEVRVFNQGTTTERSGTGAENVTSGSHAFTVPASTAIDIVILSLGYQNTRILNYSTASSATIPVSQVLDRQYANP